MKASPVTMEKFDMIKNAEGTEGQHSFEKPILDVPTRWDSTYEMLNIAI